MRQPEADSSRGILKPKAGEKQFDLAYHAPSPDLRDFVARYWTIRWDLAEPFVQETLPNPCINLVIEQDNSRIYGVVSGKFKRQLTGSGQVFSVQFRPGGFYPVVHTPMSQWTDRSIPLDKVFGGESAPLEQAVLSAEADADRIARMEAFLRERMPEADSQVAIVNQIIDRIIADRRLTQVEDLVSQFPFSKRSLQRLFSQYVGVSPKWVIKRFRIQEAAEQLADGPVDWARLALELGYFDQAHFIKDFKAMIGSTPAEYAQSSDVNR